MTCKANTRKTPRFLRFTEPCDKRGVVQLVTTPASQSALWQVPARRFTPAGRGAWTRFQSPNKCSIMRAGAERASAVKRGANLIKITDVTGHRSLEMLRTYSRDAEAFVGHAGAGLL